MENLRLIRGARLLQWLEEAPFLDLERKTLNFTPPTTKRQHVTAPLRVMKMEFIAAPQNGTLIVKSQVKSDSGNTYSPTIQFDGVEFDEEDRPDNITFKAADNKDYHLSDEIQLYNDNAKVHCNCLDFYWRFGKYNADVNSLLGEPGRPYVRKTTTYPPANMQKTPGVCKHLLKMVEELRRNRIAG